VHWALLVARAAREELAWTGLFPSRAQSPSNGTSPAPAPDRCACCGWPWPAKRSCEIDDLEIRRAASPTRDTLRIRRENSRAELFYLIGGTDGAVGEMAEAGELARLAQFVVAPRQGRKSSALPALFAAGLAPGFRWRSAENPRAGQGGAAGHAPDPGGRVAEAIATSALSLSAMEYGETPKMGSRTGLLCRRPLPKIKKAENTVILDSGTSPPSPIISSHSGAAERTCARRQRNHGPLREDHDLSARRGRGREHAVAVDGLL